MAARRLPRRVLIALGAVALAVLAAFVVVRQALVASLPQTDGTRALAGLSRAVRVERDALGIPTIRGASRLDVARATGFVHAQDRFFQMDLTRRFAAGELSELLGSSTIETDRTHRLHRLRAVARQVLARAPAEDRALLQAYADGVNAGLAALGARPPEYVLLRARPAPWLPEDCILIVGAMFDNDLYNARRELQLQAMYRAMPAPLVDFLRPLGDEWDAPLVGGPMTPPPIPGPEIVNLRNPAEAGSHSPGFATGRLPAADYRLPDGVSAGLAGSNAWALAGSRTADGRALMANDPHLPLQVPNIWYRLSIAWQDERGVPHRLTGASLAGLPFVAIGSNGHVAWGFTVAFDDRSDMVIVEIADAKGQTYRTPDGPRAFEHATERILVKGADEVPLDITSTIWGPVLGRDPDGRPLAQQWQGHHADGVNVTFAAMESATTVEQALDIANAAGLPSYNIVAADEQGSIGWTVTGRLPRRVGFDGRVPVSWADGTCRWDGWLDPGDYPRLVNPSSGRIWNANNRVVDRPLLDRLGLEGYIMGPRARQVRGDLTVLGGSTARDPLSVQLDDRALLLERWRAFLLGQLRGPAITGTPRREEFRRLVDRSWDGRASVGSVGYLLVERFRYELAQHVIGAMLPPGAGEQALRPGAIVEWWESALWRLVHERPMHLLAPKWKDWTEVTLAAVDGTIAAATGGGRPLADANWGSTTGVARHPLSRALPWLAGWLDMPFAERPGDTNMPRVRMPGAGGEVSASFRMVVSPGHEESGIFHMPGGESGHFLSPHYRDMQRAWVEGRPTPFLPGPTVQILQLQPQPLR